VPDENSLAYQPTVIKPPDPPAANTGPPRGAPAAASAAQTAPTTPQPSQPSTPPQGGWGPGAGSGYGSAGSGYGSAGPSGPSGPAGSAARPEGSQPDPLDREVPVSVIRGQDVSISTSGNGERAVPGPDGPIGHILDPATHRPALFQGTVTVAAREATSADALSTALFVMGPEGGSRWADERRIAALFLWRNPDGSLGRTATRAFDERFPGWSGSIPDVVMEGP